MDQETIMYFQAKSTDELTELLENHNTQIYKEEVFEIMQHILDGREKEYYKHMLGYKEDAVKDEKNIIDSKVDEDVKNISSPENEEGINTSSAENEKVEKNVKPPIEEKKGFFKKLANGDYGLVKTFWLYGVLGNIVVNIMIKFIESTPVLLIFFVLSFIYYVFLLRGIWNAANRYTGNTAWAILAKIAVVLGAIMVISSVVMLISAFL